MTTRDHPFAGFWVRTAARLLDLLILLAVYNLFYLADRLGADAGLWAPGGLGEEGYGVGRFSVDNAIRGVFFIGFPVFYYVYLTGAYGQTFGKMAFRIKVVNEDGSPLTYRKAFLRWLAYFLCDLTLYLGYVWVAFDKRKQGLHDRVCKTLVVPADA